MMKITDLRIEQFGSWRNLDLQLPDQGVNVFYGPNEAGKSTLLDFVRGVLYGFVPPDRPAIGQARAAENYAGSIEIEREGKRSRVHRVGSDTDRGYLTLTDNDELGPPEDRLKSWLHGVDRTFFEHVYALGLGELQELSTLHEGEVAARIYGLTLGPDGQRLIHASRKLDKLRHDLSHSSDKPGRDQYGRIEKLL
ncbi:MAG: AAA family ATPase, partial [Planctomycetaceae bacterium]|nr:AAA family ATPase [Planctomycetaceae bacterium]